MDKRRYPNVMGVVAQVCQNGSAVDSDEWLVGAFCGDECRGVAQPVGDVLMMNVFGRGGEQITFRVVHRESGELVGVSAPVEYRADLLGTMRQPYELNIGKVTGITPPLTPPLKGAGDVYDLQGRKVEDSRSPNSKLSKGVYIVTDGSNSQTQKVVRK